MRLNLDDDGSTQLPKAKDMHVGTSSLYTMRTRNLHHKLSLNPLLTLFKHRMKFGDLLKTIQTFVT